MERFNEVVVFRRGSRGHKPTLIWGDESRFMGRTALYNDKQGAWR